MGVQRAKTQTRWERESAVHIAPPSLNPTNKLSSVGLCRQETTDAIILLSRVSTLVDHEMIFLDAGKAK